MANSKIYLGSTNIGSLFQGADDISIYLGENKVYPLEEPFKWKATYSDSHTESAQCDSSSAITEDEINLTNLVSVEIGCVTSIGNYAFAHCSSLTSIDIPDSVTSIGDFAFSWCTNLTSVTIPDSVTSIGADGFYNCSSLTSITVNSLTPATLGTSAFDVTTCPIYVPCESVEAYKSASGWSTYASRITCPPFEGKWKATYSNGNVTSAECDSSSAITQNEINLTNLVSVEIGCVTSIGDNAFGLCTSLTSVTIPDSVTSIAVGAFRSCRSLTSVTIPDSVTTIGNNAFWSCTGLTSCTIGSGVTSIGMNAFYLCGSLTSVIVNAVNPPQLANDIVFNGSTCPILVPSASVEAYKTATNWSSYASRIQALP